MDGSPPTLVTHPLRSLPLRTGPFQLQQPQCLVNVFFWLVPLFDDYISKYPINTWRFQDQSHSYSMVWWFMMILFLGLGCFFLHFWRFLAFFVVSLMLWTAKSRRLCLKTPNLLIGLFWFLAAVIFLRSFKRKPRTTRTLRQTNVNIKIQQQEQES